MGGTIDTDATEGIFAVEGGDMGQGSGQTQHSTWVGNNQIDSRGKASNATQAPQGQFPGAGAAEGPSFLIVLRFSMKWIVVLTCRLCPGQRRNAREIPQRHPVLTERVLIAMQLSKATRKGAAEPILFMIVRQSIDRK